MTCTSWHSAKAFWCLNRMAEMFSYTLNRGLYHLGATHVGADVYYQHKVKIKTDQVVYSVKRDKKQVGLTTYIPVKPEENLFTDFTISECMLDRSDLHAGDNYSYLDCDKFKEFKLKLIRAMDPDACPPDYDPIGFVPYKISKGLTVANVVALLFNVFDAICDIPFKRMYALSKCYVVYGRKIISPGHRLNRGEDVVILLDGDEVCPLLKNMCQHRRHYYDERSKAYAYIEFFFQYSLEISPNNKVHLSYLQRTQMIYDPVRLINILDVYFDRKEFSRPNFFNM